MCTRRLDEGWVTSQVSVVPPTDGASDGAAVPPTQDNIPLAPPCAAVPMSHIIRAGRPSCGGALTASPPQPCRLLVDGQARSTSPTVGHSPAGGSAGGSLLDHTRSSPQTRHEQGSRMIVTLVDSHPCQPCCGLKDSELLTQKASQSPAVSPSDNAHLLGLHTPSRASRT